MKDALITAGLAVLLAGTAVFTATLEPRPQPKPSEPFYGLSQWELDNQHRPEVQDRIARRARH